MKRHFQSARKGITPVVAIVLLLMLTVAVAGGAYAWINGMIGDRQERASQDLNTRIDVKDLTCHSAAGGSADIDFFLKNSGSIEVPGSGITIYLYNVSDGSLVEATSSVAIGNELEPSGANSQWDDSHTFSTDLMDARNYRVQWEFANGHTVEASCRAS